MVAVHGRANWVSLEPEPASKLHRLNESVRDEYRIKCAIDYHGTNEVRLDRRVRTLKAEYRQKMAELDLPYEPGSGIGSRPKKPVGGKRPLRSANEHAFCVWVSERKDAFVAERRRELIERPVSRPMDFDDVMNDAKRSHDADVAKGRRDDNGDRYVPLTEAQLIERAAGMIARGEASKSMFEIGYEPAVIYDHAGRIVLL